VGVGAAFGRISPDAIVHENVVEALTGAVMPTVITRRRSS